MESTRHAKTIEKANSFVFFILRVIFIPVLYLLYRFRFDRESSKNIRPPCLVLSNHQTVLDQFIVGVGFRFGINFVASDTLFRHGLLSKIMVTLGRPIPFSKGNSDLSAIRNMMSVIRGGGCVGMFPSGNRSFFGDECTIVPGIGKLAKKLKAPLVLVRIHGGFNTKARWSAAINRGKMSARVTRVVSAEELAALDGDEIDNIIRSEICFNAFNHNETARVEYKGRRKAEYLESALFYCPSCSRMDSLESRGNIFFCRNCGARTEINNFGFFEKNINEQSLPGTILEWSRLQLDYIKRFDFSPFTDRPVFGDDNIVLLKAEHARREDRLGKGRIELFADRLTVCGHPFYFSRITTAIHGIRKMTIYSTDGVYAVIAPKRINLVKYMICAYHLKNNISGSKEEYYGY